ncbi:MAG: hypothetical protein ABI336_12255 [Humibacillus sp.]
MLFSAARKHKVVSTTSADTVAKVKDFIVDPATRHVVALVVKGSKAGDVLPWSRISGFGPDAVTIGDLDAISAADEDVAKLRSSANTMRKKRALLSTGDLMGTVTDVAFNGDTGAIESVLVDGEPVNGARLIGVGSFAVVIRAEVTTS